MSVDLDDPEMNTYEMVKERHEQECFFIDSCSCYLRILKCNKEPKVMKMTAVINHYRRTYYFEMKADGSFNKCKFIQRWLDDRKIRVFNDIDDVKQLYPFALVTKKKK